MHGDRIVIKLYCRKKFYIIVSNMNDLFTPTPVELIAELNEIWPEGNMEYRHFTIEIDHDRWSDKWVATHENYDGPESDYPVITGKDQDEVIEEIDEWLAACPHNDTDTALCNRCAGSGEGMSDGTICGQCNGSGEWGEFCNDCDENLGD